MSETNSTRIIAVFGATGLQGGSVVDSLLAAKKYRVRALTRHPDTEKAEQLRTRGCEVVRADMDNPESLRRALVDCYGIFLVTNFWEHFHPEKEYVQATNVADVASKLGVKHVVWSTLEDTRSIHDSVPFQGNYKVAHFDEKGHASKYMDSIGLPVTHLYTSFYWENLLSLIKPQKGEDGVYRMVYPMGDKVLPGVTVPDIGRAVNSIFESGLGESGETRGIASQHLTLTQMAEILSKVSGKQVVYVDLEPDAYRNLEFPGAVELGNMFQYKRDHNDEFCGLRKNDWVSWAPVSFTEWCQRHYKTILDLS